MIRDLGCGTGSLGRWLAPLLPGPQHWIMHDRDPALLAHAAAHMPSAADGTPSRCRPPRGDVTALTAADLAGTVLVTCSALLDLLTADEVARWPRRAPAPARPALFTLSVVGEVTLDPADPLDAEVAAAFNAHQRRTAGGRRLLGPDAVGAAAAAFARPVLTVHRPAEPVAARAGAGRAGRRMAARLGRPPPPSSALTWTWTTIWRPGLRPRRRAGCGSRSGITDLLAHIRLNRFGAARRTRSQKG